MKTRTKLLLLVLTTLLVALFVVPALAGTGDPVSVPYLDENGESQTHNCIPITDGDDLTLTDGEWYVVNEDAAITNRITNAGDVHLVLADGKTLTAPAGIENPAGKSLTIYGQANGTGTLLIDNAAENCAGIGGSALTAGGTVTINGGTVNVTGGANGAGIGGGGATRDMDGSAGAGGNIIINGGTVTANGGAHGAGIGGGGNSTGWAVGAGGNITINGGIVNATAGVFAAGIGGGGSEKSNSYGGSIGTIVINGGEVTARGGNRLEGGLSSGGAGIGSGNYSSGGSITINSGTVTAYGGYYAAGIGGGHFSPAGTIVINGGTVSATAGNRSSGIGNGYYCTNGDNKNRLTVTGGTVQAFGHGGGAGIGGSIYGDGIDVSIEGGTVEALGTESAISPGHYAPGIGSLNGNGGKLEVTGEVITLLAGSSKDNAKAETVAVYKENRKLYVKITIGSYPTYTVRHLLEKADGSGYEVTETETKSAPAGSTTCAVIRAYDGFTPLPFTQGTVTEDGSTVVEIQYDRNPYTIFFDANGHGEAPAAITAKFGAAVSAPTAPTAAGYTFGGWFTDRECTASYTFGTMPPGGKILYAKWTAAPGAEYTITWDVDGKTDTTKVASGAMPEHLAPTKDGAVFTGWTPALAPAAANVTYTATFYTLPPVTVAVSFDPDGGSFVDTQIIPRNTKAVEPAAPSKEGFTFNGWYTDKARTAAFNFNTPIAADTVLYAKWTALPTPEYTVTWKLDDATVLGTTTVSDGAMPTHADAEKENCIFTGWSPALAPATANVTYTAKLYPLPPATSDIVKVSYNTVFGSFIDTQLLDRGKPAVMPDAPTKDGHTFGGWYTDKECTAAFDFTTPITKDTVLYAKWTKNANDPILPNVPKTGETGALIIAVLTLLTLSGIMAARIAQRKNRSSGAEK